MDQASVLIVSDDVAFSRAITQRWQTELQVPAFTLMGSDSWHGFDADSFQLAIVGAVKSDALDKVVKALGHAGRPVLLVATEAQTPQATCGTQPKVMVLRDHEGWLNVLVLLAVEVLKRNQAVARAERAERARTEVETQATLGRYMLDMRHNLNNALTSVLGNSELLLLEPGSLSAAARSQIDTIRNMAMRMHEILQRFSSLESELKFVEQQAEKERDTRVQAAAAGS